MTKYILRLGVEASASQTKFGMASYIEFIKAN